MHLHCLAESIAASAVVQALLAVGRCRDVLPVECMSAEFWQSVSQLNYERHRERGRPAGSRTNNDGDGQLLAAAAPIPLPGYRKVRVKIGDPAAPTEVCTYLAGDLAFVTAVLMMVLAEAAEFTTMAAAIPQHYLAQQSCLSRD